MKIISWNVNGIRAWKDKEGTLDFITQEAPDVLCLQETKISQDLINKEQEKNSGNIPFIAGFKHAYWNCAEKKGYSGTVLLCNNEPMSVRYGIGHVLDNEGRVISAEFKDYFIVTVYTPNSKPDLSRLDLRYNEWDTQFLKHIKKLEKKKPVIICGDLNVAHREIDIARPDSNKTTEKKPGSPGFTDKERERFGDLMDHGLVDTYRKRHPETIQYTWWSYRAFARKRNVGWRIDYVLVSQKLEKKIKNATIYDQITGSDHCPIGLEM
jgi:exodeoxyribonuclease-3